MEDYYENIKKYNKVLWKYLGLKSPGTEDYDTVHEHFTPQENMEILNWVLHKIKKTPREGYQNRIVIFIKEEESEITIQEWFDVKSPKGFVNITKVKGKSEYRAIYNACVDYIIKTS